MDQLGGETRQATTARRFMADILDEVGTVVTSQQAVAATERLIAATGVPMPIEEEISEACTTLDMGHLYHIHRILQAPSNILTISKMAREARSKASGRTRSICERLDRIDDLTSASFGSLETVCTRHYNPASRIGKFSYERPGAKGNDLFEYISSF